MVAVRKLQAQTEAFWRDEYEVSEKDLDFLAGTILEAGKPQRLSALVSAIILRRLQLEKEAAARQARNIRLYQPKGQYEAGQDLAFSSADYAVGKVVAVRPGHDPKYGPFSVIRVAFEDGSPEREFAAGFDHPHPLNRPVEELLGGGEPNVSESDLVRACEYYVARRLVPALAGDLDFVRVGDSWFLRELMPEVHVGYLNLAEAMVYEAGHPLPTREILGGLELAPTTSVDAQTFALNSALSGDERFDNVGAGEDPVWYLRALEPEAAFRLPTVLKPAFQAAGGEYLGITMLDMVEEIGDELDDIETIPPKDVEGVHYEMSFPHLHAGTMPATMKFISMLPSDNKRRVPLVFVDGGTGQRFQVWLVADDRYVCGLGDWYASVEMTVGGQVSVTRTDEPLVFTISAKSTRSKRGEWVRSASVTNDNLAMQMQRVSLGVRGDANMLVDVPDREAIARLMARGEAAQLSLEALVRRAFEELSKLSSRGVVHAKSIYSAANMLRRTGSVPVFAELTHRACYDPVGDGFWAFNAALQGTIYHTPDEMRERPLSPRGDLVKDQVVQYLGR
jgi:hypothetical protein